MGCFFFAVAQGFSFKTFQGIFPAKVETSASRKGRAEKVSQNQLQVAGSFDNL